MLGKLFQDPTKKFVAALPDAQEPDAEFAPVIVDKEAAEAETAEAPAVLEASATPGAADTVTKTTEAAPVQAASSATVRELIINAVKTAGVPGGESREASGGGVRADATFAESYLVSAGNKSDRRRPGKSMSPFMDIASNMRTS